MSDVEEVGEFRNFGGARDVDDGKSPLPAKRKKLPAATKLMMEEIKLSGFDRSPGWHKKKNLPHMAHLGNWVSLYNDECVRHTPSMLLL
jgi:hypothetical protein